MTNRPFPVNAEGKRALWEEAKAKGPGIDAQLDELRALYPNMKLIALEVGAVRYGEPEPHHSCLHTLTPEWAASVAASIPKPVTPEQLEARRREKRRIDAQKRMYPR